MSPRSRRGAPVAARLLLVLLTAAGCSRSGQPEEAARQAANRYEWEPRLGDSWSEISSVDEKTFAVAGEYGGLLLTHDGGRTWVRRFLPAEALRDVESPAVTFDGRRVWVLSNCDIFLSANEAVTWTRSRLQACSERSAGEVQSIPAVHSIGDRTWILREGILYLFSTETRTAAPVPGVPREVFQLMASGDTLWVVSSNSIHRAVNAGALPSWTQIASDAERIVGVRGDTVWFISSRNLTMAVAGASGGRRSIPLPDSTYEVAVRGGVAVAWGDRLYFGASGLQWRRVPQHGYSRVDDAVATQSGFLITTEIGVLHVDSMGSVDPLYSEVADAPCSVQRIDGRFRAVMNTGRLLVSDDGFEWHEPFADTQSDEVDYCVETADKAWGISISSSGDGPDVTRVSLLVGSDWRLLPCTIVCEANSHGIVASSQSLWSAVSSSDSVLRLYASSDGITWTAEAEWRQLMLLGLGAEGDRVWAVADDSVGADVIDNRPRLLLRKSGRGWTSQRLDLPDSTSREVWVRGDSVWALGDDYLWFSRSAGRTWERRADIPTSDEPWRLSGRGPLLFLGDRHEMYYSADGGWNWTPTHLSDGSFLLDAEGNNWYFRSGPPLYLARKESLPALLRHSTAWTPEGARLEFVLDTAGVHKSVLADLRFELAAVDVDHLEEGVFRVLDSRCRASVTDSTRWACRVAPETAGIRGDEAGYLRLTLQSGGYRYTYPLLHFTSTSPVQAIPSSILIPAAAYLGIMFILAISWLLHPIFLFRLHLVVAGGAERLPVVGTTVSIAVLKFLLPYFATSTRVLDAWIEKNAGRLRDHLISDDSPLTPKEAYVPLPIVLRAGSSRTMGEYVGEPGPPVFAPVFAESRTAIQIVGDGGAGKTSLASALAWWAFASPGSGLRSHRMFPVWVDEETKDLVALVRGQLNSWLDVTLPTLFVQLLLSKGRLLVVADRLTERSPETREYICKVHREVRIGAMVITARRRLQIERGVTAEVAMCELTLEAMGRLIYRRLVVRDPDPGMETREPVPSADASGSTLSPEDSSIRKLPHPYWDMTRQAELLHMISALFDVAAQGTANIPIRPLLVSLAVDEAVRLRKLGLPISRLSDSVPELLRRYILALQHAPTEGPLTESASRALLAAKLAARIELRNGFTPRSFSRSEARAEFAARLWNIDQQPDPIEQLVLSGILKQEPGGVESRYRFVLDPVAEYLAAEDAVEEHGADEQKWDEFVSKVRSAQASDFLNALELMLRLRNGGSENAGDDAPRSST